MVPGQFDGYRDVPGVDPHSSQDTFVAARLWIDHPRWRGVPFYLRTGKQMAASAQRVSLILREPPGPLRAARRSTPTGPDRGGRLKRVSLSRPDAGCSASKPPGLAGTGLAGCQVDDGDWAGRMVHQGPADRAEAHALQSAQAACTNDEDLGLGRGHE